MKFTIVNQKDAPLLKRKEFNINLEFEGPTPKKEDLKKELAGFLKCDENLIVVKHEYTNFGSESAKVEVYEYKDAESLKNIETIKKRKKKEAKKKVEENAKEESKK